MLAPGALPSKLYFRIGEVASLVGVEPHVLRYWEREFRSIRPTKSAKGQRVYSRRDVENLLRVRELLYGQGFTIAGAKRRLRDKDVSQVEPEEESAPSPGTPVQTASSAIVEVPQRTQARAVREVDVERELAAEGAMRAAAAHALRVRGELEALRAEVEGFLTELGGAS